MTLLQIKMMLHYYSINEPYALRDPEHANSIAVVEQRKALIADDMLTPTPGTPSGYTVPEKGEVYIKALLRTPLPIPKTIWTI